MLEDILMEYDYLRKLQNRKQIKLFEIYSGHVKRVSGGIFLLM